MNKAWCIVFALFVGCESGSDANQTYSGITRTDKDGVVISRDDNDWKSVPASCTDNCFVKDILAFPNPTKSTITIKFLINRSDITVNRFFVYDTGGAVVKSLPQGFNKKGGQSGILDMSSLPAGIYRLKFYVTDDLTQVPYLVYGDVQKE